MAKKTGNLAAMKQRAAKSAAAVAAPASPAAAAAAAPKKPFNPVRDIPQFAREVRAEGRKITWTSRKETWITSVMVFIMVAIAAIFFFLVDTSLAFIVSRVLQFMNAG